MSAVAQDIDQGKATAKIAAYLGSYLDADTASHLLVSFQDGAGKELGTLATEPSDPRKLPKPERASTGLMLCEKSGPAPAGARKIVFTWQANATGDSGSYLALGANFSLVLTASTQ